MLLLTMDGVLLYAAATQTLLQPVLAHRVGELISHQAEWCRAVLLLLLHPVCLLLSGWGVQQRRTPHTLLTCLAAGVVGVCVSVPRDYNDGS